MPDAMEQVLRLVADGKITAQQAAPILDALADADAALAEADAAVGRDAARTGSPPVSGAGPGRATALRVEVIEDGRKVVNLRIPLNLGWFALDRIPGLSSENAELIRGAVSEGLVGQLLAIDDGPDGVRIALE
jgi:hypothetical protein